MPACEQKKGSHLHRKWTNVIGEEWCTNKQASPEALGLDSSKETSSQQKKIQIWMEVNKNGHTVHSAVV